MNEAEYLAYLHRIKSLVQARFTRLRALPDQELAERYAFEMMKLKTVRLWKQEGRQQPRPCSYPATEVITITGRELKKRGLPLPETHPMRAGEMCLRCRYNLAHTWQEHVQAVSAEQREVEEGLS